MRRLAATFALLAIPGLAFAQSPSPRPSGNVPHVSPAPSHSPTHRSSPRPTRPSPHPSSHAFHSNQNRNLNRQIPPYHAEIYLNGADVQHILSASPSPGPTQLGPPHESYPEPELFHDTHN